MQQNQSLYAIKEEHMQLLRDLEESGGELTEEIQQRMLLSEADFNNKAVSYGFVIKSFENRTDTIKAEIERLKKMQEASERSMEAFKAKLRDAMVLFNIEKIDTPTLHLSLKKSESTVIEDVTLIPKEYMNQPATPPPAPDKNKIKAAIKAGEKVAGAKVVTNKSLQIK